MDIGRVTAQEGVLVAAARQIEQAQRRTDGIVEDNAGLHQIARLIKRVGAHIQSRRAVRQCGLVEHGSCHWIVSSISSLVSCLARAQDYEDVQN